MSIVNSQLTAIKDDWQERPEPERRVLTIVGVLMMVCAVYFLIIDPVVAYKEKQQRLLVSESNKYARVVPLVERIQALSSGPSSQLSRGLAALIDSSLQENGLTMRGFQPGKNNDARLRLSDVPYESLVQWLYDLEYKHNIVIEEMSVSPSKETNLLLVNIRVKKT